MKTLVILIISTFLFCNHGYCQLTFNDFYAICNRINNPYNINKRNVLDAIDTLLAKKYLLSTFENAPAKDGKGNVIQISYIFQFTSVNNQTESFSIETTQNLTINRIYYYFTFSTQNYDEYYAILAAVRNDKDFTRDYNTLTPFNQKYVASAVGEPQVFEFFVAQAAIGSGIDGTKASMPFTYQIDFYRNWPFVP